MQSTTFRSENLTHLDRTLGCDVVDEPNAAMVLLVEVFYSVRWAEHNRRRERAGGCVRAYSYEVN